MKKTDSLVRLLLTDIEDKDILEVACGDASFSISASRYARSVSCIDLVDSRLKDIRQDNVHFEIMDAAKMRYASETFDTVFFYNALFHVRSQWEEIEKECRRVLKGKGSIYIVGTWKLDTALMKDMFDDKAEWLNDFLIARIEK